MTLLHLISGSGRWDATALAAELECSKRTVHRFLQTLSMAGVPWYFDERIRAYRVRLGYKFPLLDVQPRMTKEEPESPELGEVMDKLLRDGEALAQSLQEFLLTLKKAKKRDYQ